jgi:hypothetical protein
MALREVNDDYLAELEALRGEQADRPRPLNGKGGDGTSGGVSDDWKASVDRQLGQLHSDVRALLNRGVAAVVGLALMIGGLYLYSNQKFDSVNQRLTGIEVQQAKADAKLDLLLERKGNK